MPQRPLTSSSDDLNILTTLSPPRAPDLIKPPSFPNQDTIDTIAEPRRPPKTSGSAPWLSGPQRLRGIWSPPASTARLAIVIGAGGIQVPVRGGS
ncbi:hypothetical protein F1880_000928 [Penicillium rolfsii]|nr:hypothetical protein F1880_000928 [Penicillium rolfsii]